MAWIESHQKLERSGKILVLSQKLGINRYQAIGHLHSLWWWALDNARNGDVTRYGNDVVTQACGWTEYINDEIDMSRINEVTNRDKGECFIEALIESGFLDLKEGKLTIHDWSMYTWRYFHSVERAEKNREKTRERVRRFRNAHVTREKRHVTPPTIPNLTIPNLTKIKTKTLRFEKPTAIQISEYAKTLGFELDGDKFWNYYESKGWLIGKAPMKDWKACVRTWKTNNFSLPVVDGNAELAKRRKLDELTKSYLAG